MADRRCPYCVEEHEFKRMVRHFDGRFICSKCGHVVHPRSVLQMYLLEVPTIKPIQKEHSRNPSPLVDPARKPWLTGLASSEIITGETERDLRNISLKNILRLAPSLGRPPHQIVHKVLTGNSAHWDTSGHIRTSWNLYPLNS